MCLGKIMGLGLVYGLSSAFLGSKAALALRWIKKPPRPMETAHGTATGRAPQEGAHSEFGKNRTLRRAWPVRLTAGFAPNRKFSIVA